jgi:hypothetical protein
MVDEQREYAPNPEPKAGKKGSADEKEPWPPPFGIFDPARTKTPSARTYVREQGRVTTQVSYFPSMSTVVLEAHYFSYYREAATEREKAQVISAFFRQALPNEWTIAHWAFESLRRWTADAFPLEQAAPRRTFDRKPLEYDVEECLGIVAGAIAKPWNRRSLAAIGRNFERRCRQIEAVEEFDVEFFQRCRCAVADLRKDHREFVRGGNIPKRIEEPTNYEQRLRMQNRERLLRLVFLEGNAPSDFGVYRGGMWVAEAFRLGPPESGGPRFTSGVDMLEQLLSGRLDYAVAKFVAWVLGMDQKKIRALAATPTRK